MDLSNALTTNELAERYHMSPGGVRWWRHVGRGPRGVKVGRRTLYPLAEIERYEAELAAESGLLDQAAS